MVGQVPVAANLGYVVAAVADVADTVAAVEGGVVGPDVGGEDTVDGSAQCPEVGGVDPGG